MDKSKKLLSLLTSAAVVLSMSLLFSVKASAAAPTVNRLFGANRYETNTAIVNNGWTEAENVVIASGENYPDALSAAPFAKLKNAPIILTESKALSASQLSQLTRLKAKNAYIIGGTGVVSTNIEAQLKALGITWTRLAGNNRYETSAKIAQQLGTENGVVVASGENFPDALSIAPIAAAKGMPILLTSKDSLSDSAVNYLKDKTVPVTYVIGGTGAISDSVKGSLKNPVRIYGQDRYETNVNVIKTFESSLSFVNLYVASGANFPDALSGSALAAITNAPISLVDASLPEVSSEYLADKNVKTVNLLGGIGVVKQEVESSLKSVIKYLTIKKVDDVSDFAFINENYKFPWHVFITYEDSTVKFVSVKWDSNTLDTSKEGTFKFTGTVDGYDGKVNLEVKVIPETGNLYGNVVNKGLIVYYKDYIYYSNPKDHNYIYKMGDDLSQGTKIINNSADNINIVNDWMYYRGEVDASNNVFKMKLDGTENTRLINANVKNLLVDNNTIYYCASENLNPSEFYMMNLDGSGKVKLDDGEVSSILIEDNYVYYIKLINGTSSINRVKRDGSEKSTALAIGNFGSMVIDKGWIYYTNKADGSKIYKIKTDGTAGQKLTDNSADAINICDGFIYYSNTQDNYKLYQVRIDGTDIRKLSDISTANIYAIPELIFYISSADSGSAVYKMRLDGASNRLITIPMVYDKEPNNSIASSQPYVLANVRQEASVVAGTIENGDTDVYKFSIGDYTVLNIYFASETPGENSIISILDEDGNEVYSANPNESGVVSVRLDAEPGNYYFKVTSKNGASTGEYGLSSWLGNWDN